MKYTAITPDIIDKFKEVVGEQNLLTDQEDKEKYSHDETEDLHFYPEVVAKPETPEQVAELLKLCNLYLIPVTPRGAGTGLSGGALPVKGGLLISMERFNKISEIDEQNLQA